MITGGFGTTFGLVTRGLGGLIESVTETIGKAWARMRSGPRVEPVSTSVMEDEEMIRGWDA